MVTTELGACEWFVWGLRRSNLIDRGRLDHLVHEFLETHPGAEPPAKARSGSRAAIRPIPGGQADGAR